MLTLWEREDTEGAPSGRQEDLSTIAAHRARCCVVSCMQYWYGVLVRQLWESALLTESSIGKIVKNPVGSFKDTVPVPALSTGTVLCGVI